MWLTEWQDCLSLILSILAIAGSIGYLIANSVKDWQKKVKAKVLHAGDTFEDKHGSLFVVMDSAIDDFNYWYIVNLSQKIVVKMRFEEAEKFVADMDSVDIGYCKVNRK